MAQIGIGDPSQGANFTLTSITAVVLGGTSLLGGRGTFIGTLLGAGLIIQVLNATSFLGLDQWCHLLLPGDPHRRRRHRLQPGARQARRRLAHIWKGSTPCSQHGSTAPRTSASRRSPYRRSRLPTTFSSRCTTAASAAPTCTSTWSGPIVTPTSPHPLTGATLPQTLGHEFSATVVEIGSDVRDVKVGDRVSVNPIITCGRCHFCRRGLGQLCCAWRARASAPRPVRSRTSPSSRSSNLPFCPTRSPISRAPSSSRPCVAAYGVDRAGVVGGDIVLVTGAGPIGVLSAMYASAIGAATVVIAEPNPNRAALARAMDIGPVVDPTADGFNDLIRDLTGRRRRRPRGRVLGHRARASPRRSPARGPAATSSRPGLHTKPATVDMMFVANTEVSIIGSWCYYMTDWPRVIRLVAAGKYPVAKAVTTTIPLADVVTEGLRRARRPHRRSAQGPRQVQLADPEPKETIMGTRTAGHPPRRPDRQRPRPVDLLLPRHPRAAVRQRADAVVRGSGSREGRGRTRARSCGRCASGSASKSQMELIEYSEQPTHTRWSGTQQPPRRRPRVLQGRGHRGQARPNSRPRASSSTPTSTWSTRGRCRAGAGATSATRTAWPSNSWRSPTTTRTSATRPPPSTWRRGLRWPRCEARNA